MASIRILKREIDNLLEEVMADCYLALYFHPENKDVVVSIMEETVELRNTTFDRVNKPAEKHNPRLVRKHYAQVKSELLEKSDALFERLSKVACSGEKK